ncbi:hypothetical protein [Dialister sp.]|uniref:hypothetical protein n=1 Tax=Dialister sp. TaxID=1955814 RepID=UPI002E81AAFE|nr:hypothetical protein [Dialister sp.]MEE3453728.1 hypothetical protein [Dialister sp.]
MSDDIPKKSLLIQVDEAEDGYRIRANENPAALKPVLTAIVCRMYGIPENHFEDTAAFLKILGESYREEELTGNPRQVH